jgi:hypothetical protein
VHSADAIDLPTAHALSSIAHFILPVRRDVVGRMMNSDLTDSVKFQPRPFTRRRMLAAGLATVATALTGVRQLATAEDRFDAVDEAANDTAATGGQWRLTYDSPKAERWRIGLRLDTNGVACKDVLATFPIPMPWPEQTVRLLHQDIDPRVDRWTVRTLPGGARQVVVAMSAVPAGVSPEQTDDLVIPKRTTGPLKIFLGTSPYIDSGDSRIRAAARELGGKDYACAWEHVEAIYDWVREKVEYVEGDIKTASQALRDGKGDCEEMTSLFVAICRASKIPARMVWIHDHCYPEFYLEDVEGNGTWFPCQAAGTRQFGMMDEYRPVLQKGDRFKVPEKRQPVRYVAEFFRCLPQGNRDPIPIFLREVVPA